jgi:hypothetical protein
VKITEIIAILTLASSIHEGSDLGAVWYVIMITGKLMNKKNKYRMQSG